MSSTIFEQLFISQNIVHVGALLYLCAFLFRDQLVLRGLILLGDLVYILYFYFAPGEPAMRRAPCAEAVTLNSR